MTRFPSGDEDEDTYDWDECRQEEKEMFRNLLHKAIFVACIFLIGFLIGFYL